MSDIFLGIFSYTNVLLYMGGNPAICGSMLFSHMFWVEIAKKRIHIPVLLPFIVLLYSLRNLAMVATTYLVMRNVSACGMAQIALSTYLTVSVVLLHCTDGANHALRGVSNTNALPHGEWIPPCKATSLFGPEEN
ncbi:hypothetical protein AMTRI_Chr08g167060 [Amborella trichopoda]